MSLLQNLLYKRVHVFLSYASEHKALAERIALSLRGHGFKVFFDRDDLPPGASYDDKILRAIQSSGTFVFLVSPESLQERRYTLTELLLARQRWPNPSKAVLPVMAAPTPMASIPDYLKAVTLLEPQGNLPAEVSAAVDRMGRRFNRMFLGGLAGVAMLTVVVGWLLFLRAEGSVDLFVSLQQADGAGGAAAPAQPNGPMVATYASSTEAGAPHIAYRLPYEELMRKGGPVAGTRNLQRPFTWKFPALSVKLANNTPRGIVLTRAIVTVDSSEVVREPLILFQDNALNSLQIVNEGWGDVVDPVLEFSIKAATDNGDVDLFVPTTTTVSRVTFASSDSIPISKYVPERLASAETVLVTGTLAYGTGKGRRKLAFETKVLLDIKAAQALPPSFSYPPAFFEAGKPATMSIPLSQSIKAGEADNFLITLGTDKTSRNKLTFAFETSAGRVLSGGSMRLDMFAPRTKGSGVSP